MERNSFDQIVFKDFPEFLPNLTPREIFQLGSFGGTYWRTIFSSVVGRTLFDQHLEFEDWWEGIPDENLKKETYDKKLNKYGVKSGTSLELWESKNWIDAQDPYGWVQWYCRFFSGRRSPDDLRQISRWKNFTGINGRFRNQLISRIIAKDAKYDDYSVSPVIRQSLQHWAYQLTEQDFEDEYIDRLRKFV